MKPEKERKGTFRIRSLLFVPADQPEKLNKAAQDKRPDALILDLEDSISKSQKGEGRRHARAFLLAQQKDSLMQGACKRRLYVRINALSSPYIDEDLEMILAGQPDGIILPKSISGKCVEHLCVKLSLGEVKQNIPQGQTRIIAFATETPASLFYLGSYGQRTTRLEALTWGAENLSEELQAEYFREADGSYGFTYSLARSFTLLGGAAAGVAAIDHVYTPFQDLEGLRRECALASADGFMAKLAIDPAQVPVINEAFTPSEKAVQRAQEIITAFENQPEEGIVAVRGYRLGQPHLKKAQSVLERDFYVRERIKEGE